jgi:hypothetical protein
MSKGQKRRAKRARRQGGKVKITRVDIASALAANAQPEMWPGKAIARGSGSVASGAFETNRRKH